MEEQLLKILRLVPIGSEEHQKALDGLGMLQKLNDIIEYFTYLKLLP